MRLSAKGRQGGHRTLHERPLHKQALLPRKVEMSAACTAGRHANCYRMTCALVVIRSVAGSGTGFFISADGDILTAAHVIAPNKRFAPGPSDSVRVSLLQVPDSFTIQTSKESFQLPNTALEKKRGSVASRSRCSENGKSHQLLAEVGRRQ